MVGELIDSALAPVFPGWALSRMQSRAMLAVHAAAGRGRKNRDWSARTLSADEAILPDAATLNARSRQMARDSRVIRSALSSATRNIVGRGILPVPAAKTVGANAEELADLNRGAEEQFWVWASDRNHCDVEKRQSFWQKQRLCVRERFAVGEHFVVWSYRPNPDAVGLRLKSFEPEQLDADVDHYDPPGAEGGDDGFRARVHYPYAGGGTRRRVAGRREVRGGIELDDEGAPIAYHFRGRSLRDGHEGVYDGRPVRVPAERVMHYFAQERVDQSRGVTPLAAVLQDVRDLARYDDATLWGAIMQACVGLIITKGAGPGIGASSGLGGGIGRLGERNGSTPGGTPTADFKPGMIFEAATGDDVTPFSPNQGGGNYEPFTTAQLRGIAAGMGMSYEQVARDFSKGTYSSQRQGTNEDNREWRPEQDMLVDQIVMPVYELWFGFAVLENRLLLSLDKYLSDPKRFCEAEYVPDGHEWIDPLKEVAASEKAIALKIKTRKEIIGSRGGRLRRTFEQIADERKLADSLGLDLDVVPPKGKGRPPTRG